MKPDQLIKRRGKLGLIKVNVDLQQAKQWINERMGKEIQASKLQGCVLYVRLLMNSTAINLISNCVQFYGIPTHVYVFSMDRLEQLLDS